MVSADSDDFFSYGLHAEFDLWCEDRADEAARNAFQEWTHNVRSRLEEILDPDSLIPFDQMGISARKRKAWQRSLKNVRIELDDQKLRLFMDAVVLRDRAAPESPTLLVQSLLEPYGENSEGRLVHAVTVPWRVIVNTLGRDWSVAFQIAPEKWEELIAGAFDLAGYDEVTLTPRSNDHGRDVIAIKKGVGSVRIIGSVKAYAAHSRVRYDDVRALAGVLLGDQQASKGILTTTSEFPSGITDDPFLKPLMPYRLELMNGIKLQKWLEDLALKTT
jgi:restriction system protein